MKKLLQNSKFLLLFTSLFWFSQNAFSQDNIITPTNSGTFTVPAGQTYVVTIQAWGGGGRGGSTNSQAVACGGGGGGAYSSVTVTLSAGNYPYIVGAGSTTTADGGDSSFTTVLLAKGGKSGATNASTPGAGGNETLGIGSIRNSGGSGAAGVLGSLSGGGGAAAGTVSGNDGANANSSAAGTGANGGGSGGAGRLLVAGSIVGLPGNVPGGGGGGALRINNSGSTTYAGGAGGNGKIIISWYNQEIDLFGGTPFAALATNATASTTTGTDFGNQYIFNGTTTNTFKITNTGGAKLTLSTPVISGTNATEFTLTAAPALTLLPGASTSFNITFNPNGAGNRVATVSITNDDSNENPYILNLKGVGNNVIDSDSDGVTDNLDYDDDNDGIIDSVEEAACRSATNVTTKTIFLEEDFGVGTAKADIDETNPGATCNYVYTTTQQLYDNDYVVYYKVGGAQSDATNVADFAWYAWTVTDDHTPGDVNGRMGIFNASTDPKVFYENTINGIVPNIDVTYEFYAKNIDNADAAFTSTGHSGDLPRLLPNVKVEFVKTDGTVISGVAAQNTGNITRCSSGNLCASSEWKFYTFTANLGNLTSFKIRLSNIGPGGNGNDLAIDDIVVSQKYCDLDGDGDADLVDLDDDNDGIPDVVEAGFSDKSSNTSTMDRSNTSKWKDSNGDGMNDLILLTPSNTANVATYKATLTDSDGDGVYDFMDLDSDNDSIFDIDEAQIDGYYVNNVNTSYNGDGDVDGDGLDEGPDTDSDGIKDSNDDKNGYGTTNKPFPVDSDGDGLPNYRDKYSASVTNASPSVTDISKTIFASLDANNDGKIDGTADTDRDGILDTFDSAPTVAGSPRNITGKKLYIDFDGRNDYAEGDKLFSSATANSTIMGWIKLASNYTANGIVFGNDNFYITVDNAKKMTASANAETTGSVTLTTDRWYHVAAVYEGGATAKVRLYLNGTLVGSTTNGASTMPANTSKFTIAKKSGALTDFFRGFIDEVRVFNAALTEDQIQKMIYQEIQASGSLIQGAIIPKDIESTSWSTLKAYYRMDDYKNDVADDYTIAGTDNGVSTTFLRIYNVKYLKPQTAPMPFTTTASGVSLSQSVGALSSTAFVNGDDIYDYDYSIVRVKHNVTQDANLTGIGLIVDPAVTLTVSNDSGLTNNWYLDLDGKIDLVGKAQLVQTANSKLENTTTGSIERDQQGTKNIYNYNYWSSPVSTITSATTNNGFSVNGIMKDGTNPSAVKNITWTTGYDGSPGNSTTAITLSSYWIYKFQNVSDSYSNWVSVLQTDILGAGQGFTLKGSGASTATQNYSFVGKPNNGTISLPVTGSNLYLVGNPYPSAIDAREFIKDNIAGGNSGTTASLTGYLYLWEDFSTNTNHLLAQYKGGYATLNLVGGAKAVGYVGLGGVGTQSTKTPKFYLPVGQGFFVEGNSTAGLKSINFKNSQRFFVKETDAQSTTLFKGTKAVAAKNQDIPNSAAQTDTYPRIRLGYTSESNYHRELLLGFMGNEATSGIDAGYDAPIFDDFPSDMYFINGENHLVIQGVGYFDPASVYPLGVKADASGIVHFSVDETENMDADQDLYIYDAVTSQYHNIKNNIFEIQLAPGTYDDRFSLRFTNETLTVGTPNVQDAIQVAFSQSNSTLTIQNNLTDATIENAVLFNIIGQQISSWDLKTKEQHQIEIPINGLSAGTYIVKINSNKGILSKKIIIR